MFRFIEKLSGNRMVAGEMRSKHGKLCPRIWCQLRQCCFRKFRGEQLIIRAQVGHCDCCLSVLVAGSMEKTFIIIVNKLFLDFLFEFLKKVI